MADKYSQGKSVVALAVILVIVGSAFRWAPRVFHSRLFHSGAPPYMASPIYGVYLQGNDFASAEAAEATTERSCLAACLHDERCHAMSFVEAPWGGGVCRLKDKVPKGRRADDAVSAVKIIPL
jgi:PAN domain